MPEVKEHAPGSFYWIELGTSDTAAAKKFYSQVFGWEAMDNPIGPDEVYTIYTLKGLDVAAMYKLRPEQTSQGVPPHWGTYISVASADDAAKKAAGLGATVILEPFDVMEHGRMALIKDPQGAVFNVWQPKAHIGVKLVGESGTFCWDELWTTDRKAAAEFYKGLFGWGAKEGDMGEMGVYTEWQNGGTSIGGMMQISPQMGPIPPNWLPYFMVDDCDATVEKVKAGGGKVHVPPTDIQNVGRFAVLGDPQGAGFAIIKLTHQV